MYLKRIIVIILFIGIGIGSFFTYNFYTTFFKENTAFETKDVIVYIPTDVDFGKLITIIGPYVKSKKTFVVAAQKKGYDRRIKSGKYRIVKGMTNNDIVNTLRSSNTYVRLIFNNQERLQNLAHRISTQIEADSLSLIRAFLDTDFLAKNGFDTENAMSMYISNTYNFFWNTSATMFRDRMLKEYHNFWNQSRLAKAEKIGLTPQEVYILASIVTKETNKRDEQPRVAGVYLNRLKKRMRLQADPTVIFALKLKNNDFKHIKRVLYKDLKVNSKYNTYLNRGLPPGPITMPDISAIEAVLNPEKHAYLYFVLDPDKMGYHAFSKTLKEHNIKKAKFTRWLNKNRIYR